MLSSSDGGLPSPTASGRPLKCVLSSSCPEEQPRGEGAHHQAAQGRAATPGGQAGPAEEAATEPDPEGEHCTEGTHARTHTTRG